MKDWIAENIDPPGNGRKNWRSVFSFIGRVFGIVRDDAVKAHNAFFPYLADSEKLAEHGESLKIPHLPYDTEDEFRERVTTASFYLMRAGERAYIHEQLRAHFGDSYLLKEEFLQVFIKIAGLSETERIWVYSFLDGILDPNISLTVAEWLHYIETLDIREDMAIRIRRKDFDVCPPYTLCYDGRVYCDQGRKILCNGDWVCDGAVHCGRFTQARGTTSDYLLREAYADGSFICDGEVLCNASRAIYAPLDIPGFLTPSGGIKDTFSIKLAVDPLEDRITIRVICDGSFLCDGSNTYSIIDAPMSLRIIKELRCNGLHSPSCAVCDGAIMCDGSYQGYDGLFYSGDTIQEEII
jgi:hypothetical protein